MMISVNWINRINRGRNRWRRTNKDIIIVSGSDTHTCQTGRRSSRGVVHTSFFSSCSSVNVVQQKQQMQSPRKAATCQIPTGGEKVKKKNAWLTDWPLLTFELEINLFCSVKLLAFTTRVLRWDPSLLNTTKNRESSIHCVFFSRALQQSDAHGCKLLFCSVSMTKRWPKKMLLSMQ